MVHLLAAASAATRARRAGQVGRVLLESSVLKGSGRPVVATPHVVAVATGGLFITGGFVVLAADLLAPAEFGHGGGIRALAATAVLLGALSVLLLPRLPAWVPHVFVGLGTSAVALGTELAASPSAATAIACLMVLIAVDAAFFFARRAALVHLVVAITAGALALTGPGKPGPAVALMVAGIAALVAVVVAWLVRAAGAAETDHLTGLTNRRGLDRLLDELTGAPGGTHRAVSVAVLDVDGLKQVNDRDGRRGGDHLLVELARSWAPILAGDATLARVGGDEFAVLLPGSTLEEALDVAQRIRAATPDPHTVSIGVAQWDPESSSSVLTDAEQALYEARRSGRDRVGHRGFGAAARSEVRSALTEGHLHVHYQPVVALGSGEVVGTEALLRWQDPVRGPVSPVDFLPLIEGSGLMAEVGLFVLERACRQTAQWRATGGPATVAVNVTGAELLADDYADRVAAVLDRSRLPAPALVLEVTESSLDGESSAALQTLHRLRELGVRIAVDDFGTGYSSLGRLTRLPVDILKIDQSFVRPLEPGTVSAPLIQAVLGLAAALDLDVIAEGVEQPYQAALLRSLGCAHAQGYLFGRPVAGEAIDPSGPPARASGLGDRRARHLAIGA